MKVRIHRWLVPAALALAASSASASFIVAPHTAGRDGDLSGNTVASPDDAGSAQYINPAGVVGETADQTMLAVAPMNFTAHYDNGNGYDHTSSETPVLLNFWHGLGERNGWHMGFSTYGSVGTAFDFAADPGNGVPSRFVGKLTVINLGFNVGRQLTEDLRVGMQITPRYGQQTFKAPTPGGEAEFDIDGFGIVGSLGLVYDLSDRWALGLAYRTPGLVDMDGDGSVGGNDQGVEHELHTPQSVTAGASFQWTPKTTLLAQVKWTDYEQFQDGDVKWDETTALNQPFIGDTRNRIRWGMGLEHEVIEDSFLRVGFSYESWMIEPESVRPYLFDNRDFMLMAGYEVRYETLSVGFIGGYATTTDREVSPAQNPAAPGTYSTENDVMAGFRITWHH